MKRWLDSGEAILLDVREADEFKQERIAGAKNIPLSTLCAADMEYKEYKNKKVVIHCLSGRRSAIAYKKVLGYDQDLDVWSLEGGISNWKDQGMPTIKNSVKMSLQRQTLMAIGVLVFIFSLLSYFYASGIAFVLTAIGLALINAGATGWCGMTKLLSLMPWNK